MRRWFTGGVVLSLVLGILAVAAPAPAAADTLSLTGTLLHSGGSPVVDGTVMVLDEFGDSLAMAYADETGAVQLFDIPAGDWYLRYDAASALTSYHPGVSSLAEATPVTFGAGVVTVNPMLPRAQLVSGTVSGPGGAPVDGVAVTFSTGTGQRFATTDAAGHFEAWLQPGTYTAQFRAPFGSGLRSEYWDDATAATATSIEAVADGMPLVLDVSLAAAGSISGTVTSQGGAPAPDVVVELYDESGTYVASTTTDGTGHYEVLGVDAAAVIIGFTPSTAALVAEYHDDVTDFASATPVALTGSVVVDAELARRGRLHGVLTSGSGDPVADATVTANSDATGTTYAYTDGSGAWEMFLEPGSYTVRFRAQSGSGLRSEYWNDSPTRAGSAAVEVVSSTDATLDAQLAGAGSVSGTVTDSAGDPIPGIAVTLTEPDGSWVASATTNGTGTYSIASVDVSSVIVCFSPQSSQQWQSECHDDVAESVDATPVSVVGATVVDATLTRRARVHGTVTMPSGDPAVFAAVTLVDGTGTDVATGYTNFLGEYEVFVGPGTYRVRFVAPFGSGAAQEYHSNVAGLAAATPVVLAAEASVQVDAQLPLAGSLSGTVTDGSGDPVEGATVTLLSPAGDWVDQTVTDAAGAYSFAEVAVQEVVVQVEPPFGSDLIGEYHADAHLIEDATKVVVSGAAVVDVVLSRRGVVEGTVTVAGGSPAVNSTVTLTGVQGTFGQRTATTDALGFYEITGVEAGTYRLGFAAPVGTNHIDEFHLDAVSASEATVVTVTDGATQTIDAELSLGGAITGVVLDSFGNPMSDVFVEAVSVIHGNTKSTTTGPDGTYQLRGLLPSSYTVEFKPSDVVHLSEFYDDSRTEDTATYVGVVAGVDTVSIDAQLELGAVIAGVVTDTTGAPIEDAWVNASGPDRSRSSYTGPDGSFAIGPLTAGEYTLFTEADGFRPEYFDDSVNQAAATPITVSLGEMASGHLIELSALGTDTGGISGTVHDEGGAAIPGAYVWATQIGGDGFASTYTDASGDFLLTGLPDGSYRMWVSKDGFVAEYYDDALLFNDATPIAVDGGLVTPGIAVVLTAESSVSGTITTEDGGSLASVGVVATRPDETGNSYHGTIDEATGAYRIDDMPAGDYLIRFYGYGTSPYLDEYWDDARTTETATTLSVSGAVVGIDARLELGGTISGTVTDPSGAPLRNVDVAVDGPSSASTRTDTNGNYTIRRLRAGSYQVSFTPPIESGLIAEWYDDATSSDDATPVSVSLGVAATGIDAQLAEGLTLSGQVFGPTGTPIQGATVRAGGLPGSSIAARNVETDATGAYSFVGLVPGAYCVQVLDEGLPGDLIGEVRGPEPEFCTQAGTVAVETTDVTGIDITLDHGGSISGTVTSQLGGAVAGAIVELVWEGLSAITDAAGNYRIDGLRGVYSPVLITPPPGSPLAAEYLENSPSFSSAERLTIGRGDAFVRHVTLGLGSNIEGTVTDAAGDPLAGVAVSASGSNGFADALTGVDGTYSLAGLWPGDYVVSFEPSSAHVPEWFDNATSIDDATTITLGPGDTVTANASLAPASAVEGTVTDASDAPVSGVTVSVFAPGAGFPVRSAVTGADGTYSIRPLAPGSYQVRFGTEGFGAFEPEWWDDAATRDLAATLVLAEGQVRADIDASLARRGAASGTITDQTGAPLAGAFVGVVRDDGFFCSSCTTQSDASGNYTISGLRSGSYRLSVNPPFLRSELAPEWFDNAPSKDTAAALVMTPGVTIDADVQLGIGATVHGVVTGPGGAPVTDGFVHITGPVDLYDSLGVDGSYGLQGLPAGTYQLEAIPSTDTGLAGEWFENAYELDDATDLAITAGSDRVVDFALAVGGTITGRVTGPGGVGVADACVNVVPIGEVPYDCMFFTDASGNYSVGGLRPVDHAVCASATDLASECFDGKVSAYSASPVEVTLGATTPGVDIALNTGGSIEGLVLDEAGDPVGRVVAIEDPAVAVGADPNAPAGLLNFGFADEVTGEFVVDGLAPGTYRVRGEIIDGDTASAPVKTVVVVAGAPTAVTLQYGPQSQAPGAPTGVAAVAGASQVSLTWTAPTSDGGAVITDYVVRYSVNGGSTWTTFDDGVSTSTTANVTGLANGTAHVFSVAAVNAVGTGTFSASTAAVTPRTVPGAPTGLSGTTGDELANLSWSAPASNGGAPISDYVVQYSSNGGSTWTTFDDGVSTARSAVVTGLDNGTSYVFRVAAVNVAGAGAYSAATSAPVTPRSTPSAPAAPRGTRGAGQVTLAWSAPANGGSAITDYVVQFSSNNGATWSTFADGVRSATGATVTGLTNGRGYVFRVAAKNAAGQGAFSARSASVTPATKPSKPAKPAVRAGRRSVTLSWPATANGGSPVTDYVVQMSTNSGQTWTTVNDGVRPATGAVVTGLTRGRSYVFRVAAKNALGTGAFSPASKSVKPT